MVRVDVRDFRVSAPAEVAAGDLEIEARNLGPDTHELLVARFDSAQDLPLRHDAITVDEARFEDRTAGAAEPFLAGTSEEFAVHLDPGRYVFFCNMSGHFLGGMHTVVTVR